MRVVVRGEGRDLVGHGEDDVEVLAVEDLGGPALDPRRAFQRLTFRTVPIRARVVRKALVSADITLFDMAAERRGAAGLDRGHDAPLGAGR